MSWILQKSEVSVCVKRKALEMNEDMYGPFDPEVAASMGLPPTGCVRLPATFVPATLDKKGHFLGTRPPT